MVSLVSFLILVVERFFAGSSVGKQGDASTFYREQALACVLNFFLVLLWLGSLLLATVASYGSYGLVEAPFCLEGLVLSQLALLIVAILICVMLVVGTILYVVTWLRGKDKLESELFIHIPIHQSCLFICLLV